MDMRVARMEMVEGYVKEETRVAGFHLRRVLTRTRKKKKLLLWLSYFSTGVLWFDSRHPVGSLITERRHRDIVSASDILYESSILEVSSRLPSFALYLSPYGEIMDNYYYRERTWIRSREPTIFYSPECLCREWRLR